MPTYEWRDSSIEDFKKYISEGYTVRGITSYSPYWGDPGKTYLQLQSPQKFGDGTGKYSIVGFALKEGISEASYSQYYNEISQQKYIPKASDFPEKQPDPSAYASAMAAREQRASGLSSAQQRFYQPSKIEQSQVSSSKTFLGTVPYVTTKGIYKTGLEVTPSGLMQQYSEKFPQFKKEYSDRGISVLPAYRKEKKYTDLTAKEVLTYYKTKMPSQVTSMGLETGITGFPKNTGIYTQTAIFQAGGTKEIGAGKAFKQNQLSYQVQQFTLQTGKEAITQGVSFAGTYAKGAAQFLAYPSQEYQRLTGTKRVSLADQIFKGTKTGDLIKEIEQASKTGPELYTFMGTTGLAFAGGFGTIGRLTQAGIYGAISGYSAITALKEKTPKAVAGFALTVPLAYLGGKSLIGELAFLRGKEVLGKIDPQIVTGSSKYPVTKGGPKAMLGLFKNNVFALRKGEVGGYHTTVRNIGKEVGTSTSATSGLYIAPSVSALFARTGGGTESFGISLFRGRPALPRSYWVKAPVSRIPYSFREPVTGKVLGGSSRGYQLRQLNKFFSRQYGTGKSYISPEAELGKPEIESIVVPGSALKGIKGKVAEYFSVKQYVRYNGEKIALFEGETVVKSRSQVQRELFAEGKVKGTSIEQVRARSKSTEAYLKRIDERGVTDYAVGETPILPKSRARGVQDVSVYASSRAGSGIPVERIARYDAGRGVSLGRSVVAYKFDRPSALRVGYVPSGVYGGSSYVPGVSRSGYSGALRGVFGYGRSPGYAGALPVPSNKRFKFDAGLKALTSVSRYKSKRSFVYNPSVVGIETKTKVRKPLRDLTGLEVRGVVM